MSLRQQATTLLEKTSTRNFILGVILLNALVLGLETMPAVMSRFGSLVLLIDGLCLMIFVAEIALKFFAYRFGFFLSLIHI